MKEKVVKFFNEQASDYKDKYEKINDLRSFIFFERKRLVLDMLGKDFRRALDVGCGPGVYADELVRVCDELYGIDISSEMIEIANNKHYSNAKFSVGNIENLQFKDNFFDSVICVGVLEYLDDVEKGIEESARVIKKNGTAIFTAPNASSILNKLDYCIRTILKICRRFIKIDTSKSFMDYDFKPVLLHKSTIESLLKKYGFEIVQSKFHIFRLSFLNRLSPKLSLSLAKKLNFISNRFLAINYIVKARKK